MARAEATQTPKGCLTFDLYNQSVKKCVFTYRMLSSADMLASQLYLGTDTDIKKDFLVESQVPCVLQVLQSNAANILATALHKSGSSGHGGGRPWHC